jgi:hypothetical protein
MVRFFTPLPIAFALLSGLAPIAVAQGLDAFAFTDRSDLVLLPDNTAARVAFTGESFSVSWGDVNGNGLPDLYLNHHHRWTPGARGFPDAHLILDPGAPGGPSGWQILDAWDQHGAAILDLNGDGWRDLVEAHGGNRGTASIASRDHDMNRVFLGGPSGLAPDNSADALGLAHDMGRSYTVQPVNLSGRPGLIFGTLLRDDWRFPTTLYMRQDDGTWRPEPARFRVGTTSGPLANIGHFRMAVPGFFDTDDHMDLAFIQSTLSPHVTIFLGNTDGVFVTDGQDYRPTWFFDGVALDPTNSGVDDLWLSLSLHAPSPRHIDVYRCCGPNTESDTVLLSDQPAHATHGMTAGDFDNDMDLDLAALERTDPGGWALVIWENLGAGRFERRLVPGATGQGEPNAIARADFNRDGALDLAIGDNGTDALDDPSYTLLAGDPGDNNWLQIDLRDPWSLDGLGARVRVHAGGIVQHRGQTGGTHWAAQDHVRMHVGLGSSTVALIEVTWPDGSSSSHLADANAIVTLDHPLLEDR